MNNEIFKDIPSYEGMYQVSNHGRVKSLKRYGGTSERILKPIKHKKGYLLLRFSKAGKLKTQKVHQLVAMAFLNHVPNGNKIVVDHINHKPDDNRLENLRLVTHRKNLSHRKTPGSSKYPGVTWDKSRNKWLAQIYINGKHKHLGRFTNEEEAGQKYQEALTQIKD